jgi:3-oxoacyl-[acyl-carrier-protein] synthase II
MSPPSRFAVAAARMALHSAGLEGALHGVTAVYLATAFGPCSFSEKLYRAIVDEGPEAASPFLFTECVANAPAAQVAIACGATGPNVTVVEREAGALIALGRGALELAEGRATRALVGGVDELPPLAHALLDHYGALARATPEACEAARPFDRRRNGFVAAEGATVLVLEEEGAARARGARLLARFRAFGGAFDASASRVGWGRGVGTLERGLRRTLEHAAILPREVTRVVSGASGSVAGDRLEAQVLKAAFAEAAAPSVLAPKGVTGEYGGGFLASAVLACQDRPFGPTAGYAEPDPEVGLVPHAGGELPPPGAVLVSSLAAGGGAAWVVLAAP